MNKVETIVKVNYPYRAGGRIWNIPAMVFVKGPDGILGISSLELERIHKAIANEICGSVTNLTREELEFLSGVCGISYSEVASSCGFNRANISFWRKQGYVNAKDSFLLKKFFWINIFSSNIAKLGPIDTITLLDERSLLQLMRRVAIEDKVTFEIKQAIAS